MNPKTNLTLHLLNGCPRSIVNRIVQNAEFRKTTGIDLRAIPYERWESLPQSALLNAAQKVAEGKNATATNLSGAPVYIAFDGGQISAQRRRPDGTTESIVPLELQFFAPDSTLRLQALSCLIAEYGATGPKAAFWHALLEERPARQEEIESLYAEMRESPLQWLTSIRKKIDTRAIEPADLVPDEGGYFFRLCGPIPGGESPEEWINGTFRDHQRTLLDADLVSGLAAILPGTLRHDLGPAALLSDIDNAGLWLAIQNLPALHDPFSLLGLLDIALERRNGHAGFSALANELVERLLADPFCRPDGMDISALYPALVSLSLRGIWRTEGLGSSPPYWQRLCAFTHAGHLLSIYSRLGFDPKGMVDWLSPEWDLIDILGEVLSYRSAPMWTTDTLGALEIKTELIKRLYQLKAREEDAGRAFPHKEALDDAVKGTFDNGQFRYLPGPLEGHRRPTTYDTNHALPKEVATELLSGLQDDPRAACNLLIVCAHFAPLGDDVIALAVQAASTMPLKAESVSNAMKPLMLLASSASMQASTLLANAIADRCIHEARNLTVDADERDRSELLLRALLIASTPQPNWNEWLAGRLASYAAAMPMGTWQGDLVQTLRTMKNLIPAKEWMFGRAEALAMMANR